MKENNQRKYSKVEKNPLHPFVTPDAYFDEFKTKIMARIKEEEQLPAPVIIKKPVYKRILPYIISAAAVLLVALLINFYPEKQMGDGMMLQAVEMEDLSEEEFEQFLIDETAEDYWKQILLENENDDDMMGNSVQY